MGMSFEIWRVFLRMKIERYISAKINIILEFISGFTWQVADEIKFYIPFYIKANLFCHVYYNSH